MGLSTAWIGPTDEEEWTRALSRARHDVYHTAAYVRTAAESEAAEATAFIVDDDGRFFFLPLLLRAVPGAATPMFDAVSPYGYPGPLLNDEARKSDGFVQECIDALREELRARDICSAFVRTNPILNEGLGDLLHDEALVASGQTVSIDLTQSAESLWASMRKGHTNAINKARRVGYEVSISPARACFDQFFLVYAETLVRLRAASHYHFTALHLRQLAAMSHAYIALAVVGAEVVGAYLLFECNGIVQMHLGGPRAEPTHSRGRTVGDESRGRVPPSRRGPRRVE
jgi:hypothetical protein